MLGKAYRAFDRTLMYGVNKAVQAYNWTTGETPAELASKLQTSGTVGVSIGLVSGLGGLGILASAGILSFSHLFKKNFSEVEKEEHRAFEMGVRNEEVELIKKKVYLPMGHSFTGSAIGGIVLSPKFTEVQFEMMSVSAGNALIAASFYVMRSDYFPPRKNFISRGIDKAKSTLERKLEPKSAYEVAN